MHTLMLKKLRRNTHIAITAIVLFLVFDFAAIALNIWLSSKIEQQAVSINLAGRQRMLSQRMTKAYYNWFTPRHAIRHHRASARTRPDAGVIPHHTAGL